MDPEFRDWVLAGIARSVGWMRCVQDGGALLVGGIDPTNASIDEGPEVEEHFRPQGTIFILAVFVATLILLWGSVYVILLSRGVTP